MTLNCVIIDDEPLAAELLANYAEKVPFLDLQGTFNSATEAIKTIREKKIDLVFLDIQMPELSGLEFARIIGNETRIVFTTAFSQYAIEGYKVNALDYLLKTKKKKKFLEVSQKALDYFESLSKQKAMKEDRFIFEVKDDGPGISEKHLGKIFNMGYSTKFDEKTGKRLV